MTLDTRTDWRARGRAVPSQTLTNAECARLSEWCERWGEIATTREPGEGKSLRRFWAVSLPLIEMAERATYGRLLFARRLYSEGRLLS